MAEQDKNANEQITPKEQDYFLSTVFNLPLGAYQHFKMIFCSTKLNFRAGGNQLPTGIWNYIHERFNAEEVNKEEFKNPRYDYLRDPNLFSTQLKDTCFEDSFFQYVLEGLRKDKMANKSIILDDSLYQENVTTNEKVQKPKLSNESDINVEKNNAKNNSKLILRNRGDQKSKQEKVLPNKVSKNKPKRKIQNRNQKVTKNQRQKSLKTRKTRA